MKFTRLERFLAFALLSGLSIFTIMGAITIISPLNGGTGVSSPAAHGIMIAEGRSAMNSLTGTGCVYQASSASDPTFVPCGGGSGGGFAWGGSGTDGAITADGMTTYPCLGAPGTNRGVTSSYLQVNDCNSTTFLVNNGITVFSNGMREFATTSIEVAGTIRNNGGSGGAGGTGGATGAGGTAGVSAASNQDQQTFSNLPSGCLWTSTVASCDGAAIQLPGVVGATGTTTTAASGNIGGTGPSPNFDLCPSPNQGVIGANGGAGGAGSGHAGGGAPTARAATSCTPNAPAAYGVYQMPNPLNWIAFSNAGLDTIGYLPGRSGSTSGSSGGGDGTAAGGGGGGSGAPGGEGNIVVLCAPTVTIDASGIVEADGGSGGNGGAGGSPASGTGPGGGGGGGGGNGGDGGVIVIVGHSYTNSGAVHANGNTSPGSLGSHGTGHGSGSNGSDGFAGSNGSNGYVLHITL